MAKFRRKRLKGETKRFDWGVMVSTMPGAARQLAMQCKVVRIAQTPGKEPLLILSTPKVFAPLVDTFGAKLQQWLGVEIEIQLT